MRASRVARHSAESPQRTRESLPHQVDRPLWRAGHLCRHEFLTQSVALPGAGELVNGLGEQECVIESIEPVLRYLHAAFGGSRDGA
jgi:hypothetical protein